MLFLSFEIKNRKPHGLDDIERIRYKQFQFSGEYVPSL